MLWCVLQGHRASVDEAAERFALLRTENPTENAFIFRCAFLALDAQETGVPIGYDDCVQPAEVIGAEVPT